MNQSAKFDMIAANDNRGIEIVGHINMLRADCLAMSKRAGMPSNGADGTVWSDGANRHFNAHADALCRRYRLTNALWHAFCRLAGAR
jgi:hypothetical protein